MTDMAFSQAESHQDDNLQRREKSSGLDNSGASTDPASSLRAAALLTLKSKRRKPHPEQQALAIPAGLPARPGPLPSGESVQLDYGQDDFSSNPTTVPSQAVASSAAKSPHEEVEEGQVREEGEISDEESPATAAPPKLPIPLPAKPLPARPGSSRLGTDARRYNSITPPRGSPHPPSLVDRISDPIPPATAYEHASREPSEEAMMPENNNPLFLVDAEHVRPGLPLTQDQYDTAKDIVLDLLGWGVPPEYLVDCGLTRHIVYYVFGELNLRLPQNLDTTGLIPYTPELFETLASHLSTQKQPYRSSKNVLLSKLNLVGHNRAPASTPVTPPDVGDLHDMERQRRQELLARKAVQASRKLKQARPPTDTSSIASSVNVSPLSEPAASTNNNDIEMMSAVPNETVDDFLNSIGGSIQASDQPDENAKAVEAMDVDEIPGLFSSHRGLRSISSSPGADNPAVYADYVVDTPSTTSFPPSSTDSMTTSFGASTETDSQPQLITNKGLQRRGTKRPVAADFVDFDVPRTSSHRNTRRTDTGPNFANVPLTRCIIELSDSEGDGEGEGASERSAKKAKGRGYNSPVPGRSAMNTPNGWGTPPVQIASGPSGASSPLVLIEKELEIKKMRELIARKEREAVKKKGSVLKSHSSADLLSSAAATTTNVSVKQEEEDSTMASPDQPTTSKATLPAKDSQDSNVRQLSTDSSSIVPLTVPPSRSASAPSSAAPNDENANGMSPSTKSQQLFSEDQGKYPNASTPKLLFDVLLIQRFHPLSHCDLLLFAFSRVLLTSTIWQHVHFPPRASIVFADDDDLFTRHVN